MSARLDLEFVGQQARELEVVASISRETVRHRLKNDFKPRLKQPCCMASERDADFACQMEQVLEVYCRLYDALHPIICMDEQPRQLIDQVHMPMPAQPDAAAKEDFEYVRHGMCVVRMFVEPLAGWCAASVTLRKAAVDWAQQVRALLEALNRPGNELTPKNWTQPWRFYEDVRRQVQTEGGPGVSFWQGRIQDSRRQVRHR